MWSLAASLGRRSLVARSLGGDLIKGAFNRSQAGTLVERTSLYTLLVQLDHATAARTANGFIGALKRVDAQMRLSLTYDKGRKDRWLTMRIWAEKRACRRSLPIRTVLGSGLNENHNNLLRKYDQTPICCIFYLIILRYNAAALVSRS